MNRRVLNRAVEIVDQLLEPNPQQQHPVDPDHNAQVRIPPPQADEEQRLEEKAGEPLAQQAGSYMYLPPI